MTVKTQCHLLSLVGKKVKNNKDTKILFIKSPFKILYSKPFKNTIACGNNRFRFLKQHTRKHHLDKEELALHSLVPSLYVTFFEYDFQLVVDKTLNHTYVL